MTAERTNNLPSCIVSQLDRTGQILLDAGILAAIMLSIGARAVSLLDAVQFGHRLFILVATLDTRIPLLLRTLRHQTLVLHNFPANVTLAISQVVLLIVNFMVCHFKVKLSQLGL